MTYRVNVLFEKDEHGYFAYCPQLKGCHSQGETFEEASENIREAVELGGGGIICGDNDAGGNVTTGMTTTPPTVDAYIADFPEDVRRVLNEVRETIRRAAPDAEESISYGMPTYKLRGKPLVYFAAFKNHLGFYATPTGHTAFAAELSRYKQGKGSVQFPLDEPMPLALMARMVAFRVREKREPIR